MRSELTFLFAVVASLNGCAAEEGPEPDPVPAALHQIEGNAEDAFDHAMAGDVAAVSADAASLESDWTAFRARAVKDGAAEADAVAVDEAIAGLKAAAAGQIEAVALARAANAVSAPMSELFAVYKPPTPPALMELDYLGREVLLDGTEGDFIRASSDILATDGTWKSIRQQVVDVGASSQAAKFDSAITAMQSAADASDSTGLVAKSNEELELVDAIEVAFSKNADPPD